MRDKVEKTDLELTQHLGMSERLMAKMHQLNVRWPWLKILLVIILILGVALGLVGIMHSEAGEAGQEMSAQEGEFKDNETKSVDEEGTGERTEDTQSEVSQPEKPQPEAPVVTVPPATGKKLVALTFDDGPSATTTLRLLDILASKQVKVTFFVLGNMAQRSPEIIQREVAEGHEVESHTMSHQNLAKLSAEMIQGEISAADGVLQKVIGRASTFVRPPYGAMNATVRANVGKPMILWTVDPEDWKYRDAATVRANVVSKTFDGAIVLMHDIHGTTVDAVAGIIDDLRAAGYEFLTVSELAKIRGAALENGASYGSFRP